jgi:hypothetical protein
MRIPQVWKAILGEHKGLTWKDKSSDEWKRILKIEDDFGINEIKEI